MSQTLVDAQGNSLAVEAIELVEDMSVAVYNDEGKVGYVLTLNDQNEVLYTYYYYIDSKLAYTASSTNQADVASLIDAMGNALAVEAIELVQNMSVAVYNEDGKVGYILSLNDESEVVYSYYYYNTDGDLIYTATSIHQDDVASLVDAMGNALAIDAIELHEDMSVAVYNEEGKVGYVLSLNNELDVVYTYYYYSIDGDLIYTASSTNQADVSSLTDIEGNALALDVIELIDGMSIAVYDDQGKIAYTLSLNDDNEVVYSYYYYDQDGNILYTATSINQTDVSSLFDAQGNPLAIAQITLVEDMSIAVYAESGKIDYVLTVNASDEIVYSHYYYNGDGKLVYTATSTNQTDVNSLSDADGYALSIDLITFTRDMSVAVYDGEDTIQYALSVNSDNELVYTYYYYSAGKLIYTATSLNQDDVSNLYDVNGMPIPLENIILANEMSIAVYDLDSNRVDYVIAKDSKGDESFTKYVYNEAGKIAYTVTGEIMDDVSAIVALLETVDVSTLTAEEIEGYLRPGMSLPVYDTENERIDYIWSVDGQGQSVYTKYNYDVEGNIVFTLTGNDKIAVDDVILALESIDVVQLTAAQAQDYLRNEMSISIYDQINERVDVVWSRKDSGEVNVTQYFYDNDGALIYTITGESRQQIDNVTGINGNNVNDLTSEMIEQYLQPGMSVSVYDPETKSVDYVWSLSDLNEVACTKYFYDDLGVLAFTLTGDSREDFQGMTEITVDNVNSLTAEQIDMYLSAGMSIAVYDTENERVDHIWSRSDSGEASYTKYYYDGDALMYTMTGSDNISVAAITGITIDNVNELTADNIESLLIGGMSVAVYNVEDNKIDYIWSVNDIGDASYTKYMYDVDGRLTFTISAQTKVAVENLQGITVDNVSTLTESEINNLLSAGMSIAVYDTEENRVNYVWAMNGYSGTLIHSVSL